MSILVGFISSDYTWQSVVLAAGVGVEQLPAQPRFIFQCLLLAISERFLFLMNIPSFLSPSMPEDLLI